MGGREKMNEAKIEGESRVGGGGYKTLWRIVDRGFCASRSKK